MDGRRNDKKKSLKGRIEIHVVFLAFIENWRGWPKRGSGKTN